LSLYITEEIQEALDVEHLNGHYIVTSFKDQKVLFEQAVSQQITPPSVLVYSYEGTEQYEPAKLIDGYENVPVVVINLLIDHAKEDIVRFHMIII